MFLNPVLAQKNKLTSQHLAGTYLDQDLPGLTPQPFAPGIVNTDHNELNAFFSPDLKKFYLVRKGGKYEKFALVVFEKINNEWRESFVMPRIGRPFIAPDGKTMHLGKHYMERTESGWSEVKSLGPMFDREDWGIMRLSVSSKGTYVFDDYKNNDVIRISKLNNNKREEPKLLGKEINSGKYTAHPFIAPDESYLIWDSEREDGYGDSDLYISYRQQDDSWSEAVNLGDKINTEAWEAGAYVTSDGKYLFFSRALGEEDSDIFWVDAQIIEELRPREASQKAESDSYAIAYSSIETKNLEIYHRNAEARPTIKSTHVKGGYVAWSPDGKRIAFYAKYDEKKTWSIHTVNTDGTNWKRLTHAKNTWDNSPTWSPDGAKIVFARAYKDSLEHRKYEIRTMNSDGTDQQQIKGLSGGGPYFASEDQIVYHSQPGPSEIYIVNLDGSNQKRLTNNETEDWHPEVSPDGKEIAFMSDRDGNFEIYTMDIDGANPKRLTHSAVGDWYPSWSPDGAQIIFSNATGENGEDRTIYIMNKDGSAIQPIIEGGSQAAWLKVSK